MNYNFANDLQTIREITELTQEELARKLGVEQITISRNESGKTKPSKILLEKVYDFAFTKHIYLGNLKAMFWKEDLKENHKLLFHGSKSEIKGEISISKGRNNNDFGQGFYMGESYEQAISFISGFPESSVYYLDFNDKDLKCKKYQVDQKWMLIIAYNRGALKKYENNVEIINLVKESEDCDYIIAPIADNRMFQIIDMFIEGEITDEQCKHCLAATNLGNQYVIKSKKAAEQLKIVEKNYISQSEKKHYLDKRNSDAKLGDDKVKMARRKYRRKGKYIDEIFDLSEY